MRSVVWSPRLLGLLLVLAFACLPGAGGLSPLGTHAQDAPSVEVSIIDFGFNPVLVRTATGATVTWTNNGEQPHSVTSTTDLFDSGELAPGDQFSFTFTEPGTVDYVSSPDRSMQGAVLVRGDETDETPTPVMGMETSPPTPDLLPEAQATGLAATIQSGSCEAPGDIVATLAMAYVPSGSPVGSSSGRPVATSYSVVPVPLNQLLDTEHAILVTGTSNGAELACGDLGGFVAETGSLAVGVQGQAGVEGVAFLAPGDDGVTTASLFILVPGSLPTVENAAPIVEDAPTADVAPTEASSAVAFDSGGLGLTIPELTARYGTPYEGPIGKTIDVGNGRIHYTSLTDNRVTYLSRYFDVGLSIEDARLIGQQLVPADAVLVETYITDFGSTADIYYSPSLAELFPPVILLESNEYDTWPNAEPGQFIFGYGGYNPANGVNEVTRIVIALGNNP